MKSITQGKLTSVCKAIALVAASLITIGTASFYLAGKLVTTHQQVVNRAAKADRLALPDLATAVDQIEKADGDHQPVASEGVFESEGMVPDAPAKITDATDKNDETLSLDDCAAADVNTAPSVQASDEAAKLPEHEDNCLVAEPVANAHETSTNVTDEPEGPTTPSSTKE